MPDDAGHFAPARNAKRDGRPLMPLAMADPGQEVILVGVEGGRRFQHRMAEMGLIPGVRFRVLAKGRSGPFIISVKDCRWVLGHGMVRRVLVRPTL